MTFLSPSDYPAASTLGSLLLAASGYILILARRYQRLLKAFLALSESSSDREMILVSTLLAIANEDLDGITRSFGVVDVGLAHASEESPAGEGGSGEVRRPGDAGLGEPVGPEERRPDA